MPSSCLNLSANDPRSYLNLSANHHRLSGFLAQLAQVFSLKTWRPAAHNAKLHVDMQTRTVCLVCLAACLVASAVAEGAVQSTLRNKVDSTNHFSSLVDRRVQNTPHKKDEFEETSAATLRDRDGEDDDDDDDDDDVDGPVTVSMCLYMLYIMLREVILSDAKSTALHRRQRRRRRRRR